MLSQLRTIIQFQAFQYMCKFKLRHLDKEPFFPLKYADINQKNVFFTSDHLTMMMINEISSKNGSLPTSNKKNSTDFKSLTLHTINSLIQQTNIQAHCSQVCNKINIGEKGRTWTIVYAKISSLALTCIVVVIPMDPSSSGRPSLLISW